MLQTTKTSRLLSSAASDNATKAFDAPRVLNGIIGYNARAGTVYLKIYQLTAALAVPVNTDTPFLTIALPASSAFAFDWINGIKFNFGVGYRLVTGSADNDVTAVAVGDILGLNFLAA